MKSIHLLTAVIVLGGIAQVGEAGLFDRLICRKAAKRCDCDCVPTCQPACCKPVIVRPCRTTVHCYQRQCSTLKPPCCDNCCAPVSCCPTNECCPVGDCCAPGGCNACCDSGCCDSGCCDTGCCDGCCPETCCELAELIYKSQTGCYARHRRRAVHRMSNRYDCVCHPEVMCALIYALNDADERVRTKAADEIGDQLRDNPCCCSQRVVSALTCALGDCHWAVRRQAKQALKQCGYRVVKQCCNVGCCDTGCCGTNCCDTNGHSGNGETGPTPSLANPDDLPPGEGQGPEAAPVPQEEASPEPPSAYFQKHLLRQTSATVSPAKKGLATLLGFFD